MIGRRGSRARQYIATLLVLAVSATTVNVVTGSVAAAAGCGSNGYAYDAAGRLVGVSDQGGATARYRYDEVGNLEGVQHTGSPAVFVQSLVPVRGPVGTAVSIVGGCFDPDVADNEVRFGGVAATVTAASTERLVATVPPGAGSGPITVTVDGVEATSADPFTVTGGATAGPAIGSVTPAVVAAGASITVNGSGFVPDAMQNLASVNETRALVQTVSGTALTLEVPFGAASGRVRVRTPYGHATSVDDVFIAPGPYTPADVGFTGRTGFAVPKAVPLATAGKIGLLVFDLADGERASISLSGGTFGTCGLSAYVKDPRGTTVKSLNCAGSSGFIEVFGGRAGTWQLLLAGQGAATGTVNATVHRVPADVALATSVGGAPVTVTTSAPGQNGTVSFAGAAGQRVSVAFSGGTYGTYNASATLRRPDKTALSTLSSCGSACFFDTTVLPVDGTYSILVNPEGTATGAVSVRVHEVPADAAATVAPGGTTATLSTTVPGQNAVFSFAGTAGQRVSVAMSAGTFGTYNASAALRRPDGTSLVSSSSCGASCFLDTVTLPVDGTYTVLVNPDTAYTGAITGQVHLVPADAAATVAPGGLGVTLSTAVPGQNTVISFAGTAGQRVSVAMSAGTYGSYNASATLRRPDGTSLVSSSSCGASCFLDTVTLPVDGTYTVLINPDTAYVGTITGQVHLVPADAAATVTPGGAAATLSTTVPGQNGVVSFTGTAGQRISVTMSAGTYGSSNASAALRRPDGTSVASVSSCGTSCFLDSVTLAVDGTYTVLVNPDTTYTGALTVRVHDVPADATSTLVPGGAAATTTVTVPGQNGVFTFAGTAGLNVTVNLSGGTFGSSNATATLRGPDGVAIGGTVNCGTSCAFTSVTLPADGTYTIAVNPSGATTGAITGQIVVVPADVAATVTPGGPAATVTTVVPGQNAIVSFAGAAGQRVSVRLSGGTFGGTYNATVTLRRPDGTTLNSSTACGGGCYFDTVALPAAGTYTLFIDPQGTATGAITAQVHEVPADATAATTPGGAAVTVAAGTPGQNAVVSFPGTTGQRVSVSMTAGTYGTYNAVVTLRRPDGGTVTSSTSCGGGCFFDVVALPADGTYTVLVDPVGATTGALTVQAYQVPADAAAATTPGGAAVTATTTTPGHNAVVAFPGTTGQRVSVRLSGGTYGTYNATVTLRRPDGGTVTSSSSCGGGCFFDVVALPADGTYTLFVDPQGTATGALTAQVYDVPADATAATTPGGAAVTVTTGTPGQNAVVSFPGTTGQRVSVRLSGGTYGTYNASATLRRPDGTTLVSQTGCGASCFVDGVTLPADGTYTLLVNPDTTYTGAVTVQAYEVPADVAASAVVGGPAVPVAVTVPGQNATVSFAGTAGQRVSLHLTGFAFGGASVAVALRRPDGTTIVSNTVSTSISTSYFVNPQTLPVTGAYTVLLDPAAAATGTVNVRAYDVPADTTATTTPGAAAVPVTTTVPGQNAVVSFPATAGQRVSVHLTGFAFGGASVAVALRAPDGTALTSTTVSTSITTTAFLGPQALTAAGTYTVTVDPADAATGSVSVRVYDVPADVAAATTPGGGTVPLATGTPGQNAVVTFPVTVGQRFSVQLTGGTYGSSSASLALRRPDGTTLTSTSSCGTTCFFDTVAAPAAGTYSLLLDPSGTATGAITAQVHDVPADAAGSTSPGGPAVTVTTTVPGQNAAVVFGGAAGQVVTVAVTGSTLGSTAYSVRRPDGTALASTSTSGASTTFSNLTLPVAGTYSVAANPNGATVGAVTITVTTPAAPAPPAAAGATTDLLDVPPKVRKQPLDPTEAWQPDRFNLAGEHWRSERAARTGSGRPALDAGKGVTGLAGEVLLLNGGPLAGVTLQVGTRVTRTDGTGRFVLAGLAPGHHVLVVDGATAGTPGRTFGRHEIGVDVTAGETTALPFPIWLSRLDTANAVPIPPAVTADTVVTTPLIPGFEVRLPKGSKVTDRTGAPVTSLTVTPVPVDQPPFPLPAGVNTPVYFTVQPGGAVILPAGAQIVYPNTQGLAPGSRVEFWDYDADRVPCVPAPVKSYPKPAAGARPAAAPAGCRTLGAAAGWYVYGHGTVTADGRQVVPDPGVRVWEFTGTMINSGRNGPDDGPGDDGDSDGDPVDLASGLLVESHTDLVLPDVMPISITRTYRQRDGDSRPFGIGTNFSYGIFLESAQQYQEADLVLPDGAKVHYVRTSAGTGFTDAAFAAVGTVGPFLGSTIIWNGAGWDLKRTDGMVYVFGDEQPLQSIRDRNGNQITLTRSGGPSIVPGQGGEIVQITSPNGKWIRLSYGTGNRISRATDNAGRAVEYTYDTQGRLTGVRSAAGRTTGYAYDAQHRMTTITDARGIAYLTNTYDAAGRVDTQTLAGGATYDFDYQTDGAGKVVATTVTDPEGTVSTTTFDGALRPLAQTVAAGTPRQRTSTIGRDPQTGLPASVTDPFGRSGTYTYDAAGRATSLTSLSGTASAQTATFTQGGPLGLYTAMTDPTGGASAYAYDPAGNLTAATDPAGYTTGHTYNQAGQVTSSTDPAGKLTTYTYDLGDLVAVTDPLGRTTRNFVDAAGRTVSSTDPLGATTVRRYDADNVLLEITDPLGHSTVYDHDENGNLTGITDARGRTTTIGYDAADRVASITDPLGKVSSRGYDLLGRTVSETDRNGTTNVTRYDELGRLTFQGFGETAGPAYQSTVTYQYDALDRIASIIDSTGGTITFGYDAYDQITSVASPQGTIGYTYDPLGRRTGMTVPGQPDTTYTYDDAGQFETVTRGTTSVTWQRDTAGRIASVARPGVTATYTYDDASQVSGVTYTGPSGTIGDLHYHRDALGRVANTTGTLAHVTIPSTGPPATYDDGDRLTALGGQSFTYDDNGNLTSDGTRTYTWNARNQLSTVSGAGVNASYTYDGFGRRTGRTVNGATTSYLFDDYNLVQEQTGGVATADRLNGRLDETLQRTDGAGARSPITDQLGSVIGLVAPDGALATSYRYDPFGNPSTAGSSSGNTQQFAGRERDDETGLQHHRQRYYSPALGRFISEDPAGYAGGSTNPYLYAANDPVNVSDPHGDCVPPITIVCVAVGWGLVSVGIGWGVSKLTGRKYTWKNAAIDFTLGAVTGAAGRLFAAARAESAIARAARLGREGEAAAGIVKNTRRIYPPNSVKPYRVPDHLDDVAREIGEVKNVKHLDFRQQIREYQAWANAQSPPYTVVLWVRKTTTLSGPLQQEITSGRIVLRYLP